MNLFKSLGVMGSHDSIALMETCRFDKESNLCVEVSLLQ